MEKDWLKFLSYQFRKLKKEELETYGVNPISGDSFSKPLKQQVEIFDKHLYAQVQNRVSFFETVLRTKERRRI